MLTCPLISYSAHKWNFDITIIHSVKYLVSIICGEQTIFATPLGEFPLQDKWLWFLSSHSIQYAQTQKQFRITPLSTKLCVRFAWESKGRESIRITWMKVVSSLGVDYKQDSQFDPSRGFVKYLGLLWRVFRIPHEMKHVQI